MVQLILTSSNLALFHANDLLDYNIIKTGFFSSSYSPESITKTVNQIVDIVRQQSSLTIEYNPTKHNFE